MSTSTPTDDKRPIWQVEIRTRDLVRARAFYGGVFDWIIQPVADDYALVDTGALPVAALMQTPSPDFPVGVCHYALVPDVDVAAELTKLLGGKIAIPKQDMPGSGAFVDTLDPWGNELAFWQQHRPATPKPRGSGRNVFCWLEIPTADFLRAVAYYGQLVGWSFSPVPGISEYGVSEDSGLPRGVGLVGGAPGRHGGGMTAYITVDDMPAALERVARAGGRVIKGPQSIAEEGGFAIFLDPDGNKLGLFQTS